ncbi:MAG TPA: TonB-dependent receptor [Steroidobacteraceae bacterium]|nr:TonB-dependent receptor [Steroidobacteraceae bacterium]
MKTRNPELRIAIAVILASAGTQSVHAAETPEGNIEEVIVTSYRQSLEQSLDIKRESAGAVDAIFAEDIADFPDANLAESVQRIPGVAIDRVGGEGRQISIRGLSPEFSRVRINGMEALTTTSATDFLGTNRTRAFDFNVFASELFNQIQVRKTQSAEIDEGSLGATMDLYTARPFDFDGTRFVASYQQTYSDLADEFDPRGVGLVSFSNDSKTFGVLFSAAYSERHILEEGAQSGGWEINANTPTDRWLNWNTLPAEVNNAVHARFPRYTRLEHEQERLGLTGSVQWQPSDSTSVSFDVMHSSLDAERTEPFMEAISMSRGNAAGRGATTVRAWEIDENNSMVYGVFDGVDVRSENRLDVWNTEFNQYSLTLDQNIGERFSMNVLVGTSKSELEVEKQTTVILENFDSPGFVYDVRGNPQAPYVQYGFDVTNAANWRISELRDRPSNQSNSFDVARVDTAFEMTDALTLKAGVSWKEFEFDVRALSRDRALPTRAQVSPTAPCQLANDIIAQSSQGYQQSIGEDMTVAAGVPRNYFVGDINTITSLLNYYDDRTCFPLTELPGDVRNVIETDTGGHIQVDFNTELFGIPFRGDVGVRYVQTELQSTGLQQVAGANVPVTVDRKYSDTLPSVNLAFEVMPDFIVRAAFSKVMSRPALGNLTPGGSIGGFSTPPTVNFGNPDLDPFRADAYDLSFEWYFAEEALVALALFRKDIDSFPATTTTRLPWSSLGLPDSLLERTPALPTMDFDVRTTVNGTGGRLTGFEIQYQQPFTFLPGPDWVRNFGTILNYTNVESDVNFGPGVGQRNLTGLSENSANATLYYDNDTFSARVSVAYRDSFQRNATGRVGNDIDFTDESTAVDFSTSYKINDNFKLSLEALNITDEYRIDYTDTVAERFENSWHTGRLYLLGAQYSY